MCKIGLSATSRGRRSRSATCPGPPRDGRQPIGASPRRKEDAPAAPGTRALPRRPAPPGSRPPGRGAQPPRPRARPRGRRGRGARHARRARGLRGRRSPRGRARDPRALRRHAQHPALRAGRPRVRRGAVRRRAGGRGRRGRSVSPERRDGRRPRRLRSPAPGHDAGRRGARPSIACTRPGPTMPRWSCAATVGDAERAFPSADLVVEEELRHPRITAVPIEPRGVLAFRDPESGHLVVWSSTQNPYLVRDVVAAALGLPGRAGARPGARRGRRVRAEGLRLPRGAAGPGRRAAPRPPGQVGRGPPRALRRDRARPRAGARGAHRLPAGRHDRGDRGRVHGRRRRLSRRGHGPDAQHREPPARPVPRPPLPERRHELRDEQDAERRVPRRGTARSRLRHGAAHRHRRAAPRPRSRSRCGGATWCSPARCPTGPGSPTRTGSPSPTIRATSRPGSTARSSCSARGAPRPPAGPGVARGAGSASASPATSRAPASGPTRARRSASIRAARSS